MASQARSQVRPKRSVTRPDYRKLAEVSIPKVSKTQGKTTGAKREASDKSTQLFRLQVVDEDVGNELVKVHYIGYDSRFDEWRPKCDVVDMHMNDDLNMLEGSELTDSPEEVMVFNGPVGSVVLKPFSLYEELAYRIIFLKERRPHLLCINDL